MREKEAMLSGTAMTANLRTGLWWGSWGKCRENHSNELKNINTRAHLESWTKKNDTHVSRGKLRTPETKFEIKNSVKFVNVFFFILSTNLKNPIKSMLINAYHDKNPKSRPPSHFRKSFPIESNHLLGRQPFHRRFHHPISHKTLHVELWVCGDTEDYVLCTMLSKANSSQVALSPCAKPSCRSQS